MNPKRVITFGEIMLRLSPPPYQRMAATRCFESSFAGGEANVAVSLANYGVDAYFVSKIPEHDIGNGAVQALQEMGVHTDYIVRGGNRLGVYYLEHGASIRASKVLYDRAASAIACVHPNEFDFEHILEGADWLHISGITPALSDACAELTKAALQTARSLGITTSFDLNYRRKLWTPAQAQTVSIPLMEYVDVCIGNEEDAEMMLGFKAQGSDVQKGTLDIDGYKRSLADLQQKFAFKYIATTLRESISASDNGWSALLYDGTTFCHSRKYQLHIVDRVGGGDAFSGALIYALLNQQDTSATIEFAAAASALKHTIPGDFNRVSVAEVHNIVMGGGSGRVVR